MQSTRTLEDRMYAPEDLRNLAFLKCKISSYNSSFLSKSLKTRKRHFYKRKKVLNLSSLTGAIPFSP